MSYSFSVKAASKDLAGIYVRDELVKVVTSQPVHKKDCDQAQGAAEAMIGVLADDETKDVCVSVSGYLSWSSLDSTESIQTANVSVTASLSKREAA